MKIALITACLAGVAHSKMAALALKKEAKKRGYEIAVEEQGGHKIPIKLSKQDIAESDIVIIAKMVSISGKERFKDKTILDVSVNQAVGRILRKKDHEALVIDIIDVHGIFQRHWTKRLSFYKKQKFKVIKTSSDEYKNDNWDTIIERKGETLFTKTKNKKQSSKKISKKTIKIKTGTEILNGTCLIDDDD